MISVVIPAFNAQSTLGAQLAALAAQSHHGEWELVLADNGSTDATVSVARAFDDRLPVRVVDASARRGPGAARNVGAGAASGDVLLFCDADDVVLAGWLEALVGAVRIGRCATGPYYTSASAELDPADFEAWQPSRATAPRYFDQVTMVQSNNFGIMRADFEGVGGFDESFVAAEDAELGVRLHERGCEIAWCREARIVTRDRSTVRQQFRQFAAYGRWDVAVYKKHRGRGLERPSTRAALRDYGSLVVHLPRLLHPETRRSWVVTAGQRTGRVLGSCKERTLCL